MIILIDLEHHSRDELVSELIGIAALVDEGASYGESRDNLGKYMGTWEVIEEKEQEAFK